MWIFGDFSVSNICMLALQLCVCVAEPFDEKDKMAALIGRHQHKSSCIEVTRGDYAPFMQDMLENLEKAKVSGDHLNPRVLSHTQTLSHKLSLSLTAH